MAETPYSICSNALSSVGCPPITSFEDGSTESTVSGNIYELKVRAALSSYPWGFAKAQFQLNKLTEVPLTRFGYFYQLPADLLVLRGIYFGSQPITYERYEDRIATDWSGELVAEYTYRAPEALFPPYFIEALSTELAAQFARSIRRDESEGKRLQDVVDGTLSKPGLWAKARNLDSQQQTALKLRQSRLVTIRGRRG